MLPRFMRFADRAIGIPWTVWKESSGRSEARKGLGLGTELGIIGGKPFQPHGHELMAGCATQSPALRWRGRVCADARAEDNPHYSFLQGVA